jgi:hypothetical protein
MTFMAEEFKFQEKFITQLKAVVPPNISLADELADVLKISTDSVYRRLRCQSTFSFDEVASISKHFGITLDGLLQIDSLQVSFNFNPLYDNTNNFSKYLANMSTYLHEVSLIPNSKIIYAAEDVPFFRHFNYPTLSSFKSFYWSRAVLNSANFQGKKFNPDLVPQELINLNKSTYNSYTQINSIEIWTEETLTSTLKQVEFFWESDLFENQIHAIQVVDEISQMMDDLKSECEDSYKNSLQKKGEFMLYNAEVLIGNNCVLIEPGSSKMSDQIFIGINTFNSISTYNAAFVNETKLWMENLIKKSLLLSGTAEKQRARFFKKMENQIENLRSKVSVANSN